MYYELIINTRKKGIVFTFGFGNTSKIELNVAKDAASITVVMNKKYKTFSEAKYLRRLLKEAIRRIALIHILKYGKGIVIKSIELYGIGQSSIDLTEQFQLFSLVEPRQRLSIPDNLSNDDIIQCIMNKRRSQYDNTTAALFAFILSLSQEFETQKFFYLWMAFNGLYSYHSNSRSEKEKIETVLQMYGIGSIIRTQAKRNSQDSRVKQTLVELSEQFSVEALCDDNSQLNESMVGLINSLKEDGANCEFTPYGFILGDFAYTLRCSLFHANKPVAIFAFIDDIELILLHLVNEVLGHFLSNHLYEIYI